MSNVSRVTQLPNKGCKTGTPLEKDDQEFVEKSAGGQNIFFRDWVSLCYSRKEPKKRILAVTTFRVFTVKQQLVSKDVRQSFPILLLSRMTVKPEKLNEAVLEFGADFLLLKITYEESVLPIMQSILFAYEAISYGFPAEKKPKIELPPEMLMGFIPPQPDEQDGFLATYLAYLDLHDRPLEGRLGVLEHLMTCFQCNDHVCSLSEAFRTIKAEKDLSKDVLALASTIRNSQWFTAVSVMNFRLGSHGLTHLCSQLLETPTSIDRLDLFNIKGAKSSEFAKMARCLAAGKHGLSFLNLNKNDIGDAGAQALCDALLEGKRAVETLCLRDCKLGPKGIRAITSLFTRTGVWSTTLKVLDLSENALKAAGNQALSEWVKTDTCSLEQLFLAQCTGFDGEQFFNALLENKESNLSGINISGNKMNKNALQAVASVIEVTDTLRMVSLSNVDLQKKEFLQLFEAVFNNKNEELRFLIDVSSNPGLAKCGKDIMERMAQIKKKVGSTTDKLEALSLNDCSLGTDGVIAFCTALSGITISSLGLSKNVKDRLLFGDSVKKAGEAIAVFLTKTPSLSELTISGTGGYAIKHGIEPILQTLIDCKTVTVEHLDISGNKIGDKNMIQFAKAIKVSSSLQSVTIDGNDLGQPGLEKLREAICASETLQQWTTPQMDLQALAQKLKAEKARAVLQDALHAIEATLSKNLARHISEEEKMGRGGHRRGHSTADRLRASSRLAGMQAVGMDDSARAPRTSLMFTSVRSKEPGSPASQSQPGADY